MQNVSMTVMVTVFIFIMCFCTSKCISHILLILLTDPPPAPESCNVEVQDPTSVRVKVGEVDTPCVVNYSIAWISLTLWSGDTDENKEYSTTISDKGYPISGLLPYSNVSVEVAATNAYVGFGSPTYCSAVTEEDCKFYLI